MKRFSLFLALATLLFCACDSDTVKVRGEVEGLNGTVKLLAEMPGEPGLTILAQQEVKDGKISLKSREEYGLILMERLRLRLFWIQKI